MSALAFISSAVSYLGQTIRRKEDMLSPARRDAAFSCSMDKGSYRTPMFDVSAKAVCVDIVALPWVTWNWKVSCFRGTILSGTASWASFRVACFSLA
jgi:hypothetical protein